MTKSLRGVKFNICINLGALVAYKEAGLARTCRGIRIRSNLKNYEEQMLQIRS